MAKVRVAVCNLQAAQEKAIDAQDFLLAEQFKEEIKEKRKELGEMEEALNAPPDEEVVSGETTHLGVNLCCCFF